ncbi:MAG: hypothetical protein ACFFD1_01200 [Candidatus Thorarchaeota archaeon]
MSKKTIHLNKNRRKEKLKNLDADPEDYVPLSPFARIKSVWFFNRVGIRAIPYIEDLRDEAIVLYSIPMILRFIGIFIALLGLGGFDLFYIIETMSFLFILEILSILLFLLVLYIAMRLILPGFPKESHGTPMMVFIAFSYVYLVRIIWVLGEFIVDLFLPYPDLFSTSYNIAVLITYIFSIYFVVIASFAVRSLTGTSISVSLITGFALFIAIVILLHNPV